ncbi:MAG: tetratricopeptide repeat protein [Prolixibacteraceae bacterium]
MRYFILYIFLFLFTNTIFGQQINVAQNDAQLAQSYYQAKEYEKSAKLYLDLYEKTTFSHYFDYYINSLVYLKDFDTAIKALKKEFKKSKNPRNQIILGYVYNEMGETEKSVETFDEVIKDLTPSNAVIITIGNEFFQRREFEYAEKTYLRGREILPGEMFYNNLANVYAYLRDYSKMMIQYMALVKEDEKNVLLVENRLNALLRTDFDGSLRTTIKKEVIKNIQADPNTIAFNRILIWFFVTEKDYEQAVLNSIALDRRTKTEDDNIINFARNAAEIQLFDVALQGLDYLNTRHPEPANLNLVKMEMVRIEFLKFINTAPKLRTNGRELVNKFENILNQMGYSAETSYLIQAYAHFLAFYLFQPNEAMAVLEKGLSIRDLNNLQRTLLKVEQADINVFNNKLWEATLQYAQIIESNRENSLGDEVKLKKAKLGFYLGDIEWARGQLDALKASTSKLIANDAMELSLLISANYDLDSLDEPIQMFARGDLYLFQNNDKRAESTFDSLLVKYPSHSLSDKILMRKAQIAELRFDFVAAAAEYDKIVKEYTFSSSADDAMYKMAQLYETKLNNPSKAQELYKQLLLNYPGSIYVVDSRTRYRTLRGDYEATQEITPYESPEFITP